MATLRLVLLLLCSTQISASWFDGMPGMHDDMKARYAAHAAEMEYNNKVPDDQINDWTVHEDVDKSFYWFSRIYKRSTRTPPKGWKKDAQGKWKGPVRQMKHEL